MKRIEQHPTKDYDLYPHTIKYTKYSKTKVRKLSEKLLALIHEMERNDLYLFGGTWGINICTGRDHFHPDCIVASVGGSYQTSGGDGGIEWCKDDDRISIVSGSDNITKRYENRKKRIA